MGTRNILRPKEFVKQDHPHACGDKRIVPYFLYPFGGSSPRVWGQGSFAVRFAVLIRIIPTRVGTSFSYVSPCSSIQDHPHACGDKLPDEFVLLNDLGSSPRVWGQESIYFFSVFRCRIIPTRVGTSILGCIMTITAKDHPHACGDKTLNLNRKICNEGSSPRVWGQV